MDSCPALKASLVGFDRILDWLYLGNMFAASNKQLMLDAGIKRVCNCAADIGCPYKKVWLRALWVGGCWEEGHERCHN